MSIYMKFYKIPHMEQSKMPSILQFVDGYGRKAFSGAGYASPAGVTESAVVDTSSQVLRLFVLT